MSLELLIAIRDVPSKTVADAITVLGPDAPRLSRQAFVDRYVMPMLAQCWHDLGARLNDQRVIVTDPESNGHGG